MTEDVFLYSTTSPPFSQIPHTCAAAPGKSRTCGEQVAHPVFFFPVPRTHAVLSECGPAHGSCFLGQAESLAPVLCAREETPGQRPAPNFHEYAKRGAERSPTHRNARKAELWSLAFRAFPMPAGGLRPEGPLSRPAARLRRASRAPCLCFRPVSHAHGCFQVRAHAGLLFSQTGKKPNSCSLRPGRKSAGQKPAPNFHKYAKRGAKRTPTHRNARKAELCSLAFRAFPMPAGGLRPKGR